MIQILRNLSKNQRQKYPCGEVIIIPKSQLMMDYFPLMSSDDDMAIMVRK